MSLLGTRRAADELSRALDGSSATGARPGTGAGVPASTASLAALAERLRTAGTELESAAVPREDFRAALRTRLVAVATVQPVQPAAAPSSAGLLGGRRQKAVGVLAGALASVVAVSGVAVASSQALPGDPFYGVKRTVEGLQLRVAGDSADQGRRHLQFAGARLDEVRDLALGRAADPSAAVVRAAADADWDRVRDTLADMDGQTRTGSALLEQVWRADRDPEALTTLSDFASRQTAELQQLLPVMAPEALGDVQASLGLVAEVAARTSELRGLTSCTETCQPGTTPSAPGSSGGACDCPSPPPASPQPTATPGASSTSSPAARPSGSAPSSVAPDPDPAPTSSPSPAPSSPPSRSLPPVPTLPPAPSSLPTPLPTGAPSLPTSVAPVPSPSLEPVPDDPVPDRPTDLLPG